MFPDAVEWHLECFTIKSSNEIRTKIDNVNSIVNSKYSEVNAGINELKGDLDNYNNKYKIDVLPLSSLKENTFVYSDGERSANGWRCTDYIPIAKGDRVKVGMTNAKNLPFVILYDAEKNYVGMMYSTKFSDTPCPYDGYVDIDGIAFARFNVVPDSLLPLTDNYIIIEKQAMYLDDIAKCLNEYVTYDRLPKLTITPFGSGFFSNTVPKPYDDLDTVGSNTILCYGISTIGAITHNPPNLKNGFTLITFNYSSTLNNGAVQIASDLKGSNIAFRVKAGTWSEWFDIANDKIVKELNKSVAELCKISVINNVFDRSKLISGYIIDYSNGLPTQNEYTSNYAITDFIPVSLGDTVSLAYVRGKNLCGGALYDKNKEFITAIWGTDDFSKPNVDLEKPFDFVVNSDNVAYFRYNVQPNTIVPYDDNYAYVITDKRIKAILAKNPKVYYVGSTRNGDNSFRTLKACTEFISDNNIQNVTVYVDAETFDLVNEYGQEYLDSITSTTNKGFGLHIGNNTHYVFSDGSKVLFNYTGENSDCAEFFSAFNITGSVTLENANIEVSNARYCVHEDLPTSADVIPEYSTIKYINCVMEHKGDTIPSGSHNGYCCIGAGTNKNTLSIIRGGKYKSVWKAPISYHNYNGNYPSRIILENVWIDKAFRLADFGTNEVEVEITGCYIPNGIIGTHTYFTITEWNNVLS